MPLRPWSASPWAPPFEFALSFRASGCPFRERNSTPEVWEKPPIEREAMSRWFEIFQEPTAGGKMALFRQALCSPDVYFGTLDLKTEFARCWNSEAGLGDRRRF